MEQLTIEELAGLRQEVCEIVEKADRQLLQLIMALADEYNGEDDFTEEEIAEYDKILEEEKDYTIEEANEFMTGKRSIDEL